MLVLHCLLCTSFIFLTRLLFGSGYPGPLIIESVEVTNNSCLFRNHAIGNGEYGRPGNHCIHAFCMVSSKIVVYKNCMKPVEHPKEDKNCSILENTTASFPYCCPATVCSGKKQKYYWY
uniref:8.9 kDa family member n=1 Tax=Rhipicephalus appendiculatus TaxID=34631 RepID=A0A131YFR4_RHIAP